MVIRAIPLLAVAAALAAGEPAAWPSWLGPSGTSAATPTGKALLTSLAQVPQVWKSEALPDGRAPDVSDKVQDRVGGGLNGAVLAGGRLFFTYYAPSGDVLDEAIAAKTYDYQKGVDKKKWAITADDVVIAIDAATGKTAWRTVLAGKGINYGMFNKGGPSTTPCVHDGKVFVLGTMAVVFCLDAASGRLLWEGSLGSRTDKQAALRALALEKKVLPQFNRDFRSAPAVIGGVLVSSDHLSYKVQVPIAEFNWGNENGVVGLDLATGQRRWHVPSCLGWATQPLAWKHAGKELVIAAAASNRAVCIDPADGTLLWESPTGATGGLAAVAGDLLLCNAGSKEAPQVGAWRLSASGATKAWTLPAEHGYPNTPFVVLGDHVYASFKKGGTLCIELATGTVVAKAAVAGGGFLVGGDGRLLLQADGGHGSPVLHWFDADPRSFKPLGTWTVPLCASYTSPMMPPFADGRIYLRLGDGFACYDLTAK